MPFVQVKNWFARVYWNSSTLSRVSVNKKKTHILKNPICLHGIGVDGVDRLQSNTLIYKKTKNTREKAFDFKLEKALTLFGFINVAHEVLSI